MNDPRTPRHEVEKLAKVAGIDRSQLNEMAARFICQGPRKEEFEWHARCAKCGDSFWWKLYHEQTFPDGLSAHPLCEECHQLSSPSERVAFYESFFEWYVDQKVTDWRANYRANNKMPRRDVPYPPPDVMAEFERQVAEMRQVILKG